MSLARDQTRAAPSTVECTKDKATAPPHTEKYSYCCSYTCEIFRILHLHADVVLRSSFRVSLRIFEQKRDCSQSTHIAVGLSNSVTNT